MDAATTAPGPPAAATSARDADGWDDADADGNAAAYADGPARLLYGSSGHAGGGVTHAADLRTPTGAACWAEERWRDAFVDAKRLAEPIPVAVADAAAAPAPDAAPTGHDAWHAAARHGAVLPAAARNDATPANGEHAARDDGPARHDAPTKHATTSGTAGGTAGGAAAAAASGHDERHSSEAARYADATDGWRG